MRTLLIALTLAAATTCNACLWDYDTLAQESAGMPDVKAVIAGGFPRNPPLYYEIRLERVTKLLADNPDDLDAYDAAAVSCDRLGRSDEAIDWMARKLAAMDRMGYDSAKHEQPNHRYRYLANLGTFHAHRWFKNGANRDDMADMERGRDLIKQAIEENPNAHFGREKYQLKFMEWVLSRPTMSVDPETGKATEALPDALGLRKGGQLMHITEDNDRLKELGLDDALDGVAGLVSLGAGWESVDIFYQLALLAQNDAKSSVAFFALQRAFELVAAGKGSIVENAPRGPALAHAIDYSIPVSNDLVLTHEYAYQRGLAEGWQVVRTNYILKQAVHGKHPDTDKDFWSGFPSGLDPHRFDDPQSIEPAAQSFHENWRRGYWRGIWEGVLWGAIPAALLFGMPMLIVVLVLVSKRRVRKKQAKLQRQYENF